MVRRDAAAWSAARSVGSFIQQITRQLEAAVELEQVKACIRAINTTFIVRGALIHKEAQQPWFAELDRALEQQASAVGWPLIQQCFYEDQFPACATTVLTVAAGVWLSRDNSGDLASLISTTFISSPAAQALEALVGHLSAVLPKHSSSSSNSRSSRTVAVTAVAADTAADLLQQRFAAADSSGLQELLYSADCPNHHHRQQQQQHQQGSDSSSSIHLADSQLSPQQQDQDLQQQQQQLPATSALQQQACIAADVHNASGLSNAFGPLSDDRLEEVALQLASIPDRVQLLPEVPTALQPHPFVHHILQQAVSYITQASTAAAAGGGASSDGSSSRSATAAVPGAVRLSALLLQKFVTRGHAGAAAAAVLHLAGTAAAAAAAGLASDSSPDAGDELHHHQQQQHLVTLQSVLLQLCDTHSAATEKLLVQMLRMASVQQQQQQPEDQSRSDSRHQGGQQGQQQQQQQGQQQQLLLQALLCPMLQHSPSLCIIATQQMLLRRTLPTPALNLLLLLLDSCQPSLIPAAAVNLAQAWSDKDNILHISVQQQAYMTAALVGCIERLPRSLLDPVTTPVDQSMDGLTNGLTSQTSGQTFGQTSSFQGSGPQQLSTLLPSILHGVSTRLSSPSAAVRAEAMRVGRVFSVKLDPAKPLFEEAGDLGLMPEEIWPGALGFKQIAEPLQHQKQQRVGEDIGPSAAANNTNPSSSSSSSNGRFQALNRLHEALASPEPDSDDEDGHTTSAAAAGSGGVGSGVNSKSNIVTNGCNRSGDDDDDDVSSVASDDGSVSSLIAFDLQDDVSCASWWGPDGLGVPESGSLSLRGLAAALRKNDDMDAVLHALAKVEVLVRAEPDELPVVAPELARSLLHCKIPAWTTNPEPQNLHTTPGSGSSSTGVNHQSPNPAAAIGLNPNAEVQRQRALIAVLSLSPLTVGDTLIAEVYSPHLDQYQRMLVLDTLAAAAAEMSDPRKAPRLVAAAAGQVPRLMPSVAEERRSAAAAAAAAITAGSGSSSSKAQSAAAGSEHSAAAAAAEGGIGRSRADSVAPPAAAAAPGMAAVSSRVWGRVSLQKQQQAAAAASHGAAAAAAPRTFKNRFAPAAIRWTSMLLRECDVKHHGIDLFGRDSLLLGRLLTVLGSFVEAAAATAAAVPLAAGLLEVLRANEVSGHQEVFVRRSALIAASQIVRHLPPARLAGAMISRQQDAQDEALVHRLQWLINWCQNVASQDVDDQCRMLAAGCCAWHVELAEGAMACIEHLPESEGVSLVGSKGRGVGVRGGIEVSVPRMSDRMVLQ